jgi:uncharacterized membrane protein
VNKSGRYLAFFAYLLSIAGALYVLLARRNDSFAVFHAKQSMAIAVALVATPLVWVIVAWAGAWIPIVGPLIGLSLFALVIATYIGLFGSWIAGMMFALQGRAKLVPLIGAWAVRPSPAAPEPMPALAAEAEHRASTELIERTTPDA